MKKTLKNLGIATALLAASNTFAQDIQPQGAEDLLTGDTRLACEAILCLSSGERPSECANSLRKYYSIRAKKWHKTVAKRKDFLKLCPASSDVNIDKIANSRGACDRGFFGVRRLDRCLKRDSNNFSPQDYDKAYQKAIDDATAKHKETMAAMGIDTAATAQVAQANESTKSIQSDPIVFNSENSDNLTLDNAKKCVKSAEHALAPNSRYKISFSRLGSTAKESASFTTGQSGNFSLCLANTMFDSKAAITVTDTSGNVIYQLNKDAQSRTNNAVEIELKRSNEIYNRNVTAEEQVREMQDGKYWLK
ncbi:TrbM/KikA/MpfK family conjugal transfer protein [Bisgaard Taxon 10/6]|uniref:TrbM/KikA/MpfK family conjugal transfer protein n=1 Tax=Exercitatus varius TaxID=67857 RepID=UPI00294B3D65|nr:TrbM/KikA/MpfK family conjugal transfer protein [Exercitatus varius]MDG2957054.1 TrbM/KikA/MpfK family conjugal transfer protein [Exercitatus varius]MDG2965258.1 TrbM/KikA/MpfK family conjugal transfer protein [Exercitatus varius]